MSNFLAIATVTAALQQLLQAHVAQDVANATVKMEPPKPPTSGLTSAEVNIFLYQVVHNSAYRNMDLPTRDSKGNLVQQSRVALDLFYLLNFSGDEQKLEPQRLLGSVVRILHEQPYLTKDLIAATIKQPLYDFLTNSNLADTLVEQIKLTPHANPFEDIAKLWTSFFTQTPYTISLVYQASVVFIEGTSTVLQTQPVKERVIQVTNK